MNQVPVSLRTSMLEATLALGTLKAVLMEDTYTFDPAHAFLSDLSDTSATATVTSPTVTAGEVFGTVNTFTAVAVGPDLIGWWFYVDTGSAATSPLCSWHDQWGDFTAVLIETNGGDIDLTFINDRLFGVGSPV